MQGYIMEEKIIAMVGVSPAHAGIYLQLIAYIPDHLKVCPAYAGIYRARTYMVLVSLEVHPAYAGIYRVVVLLMLQKTCLPCVCRDISVFEI